MTDTTFETRAGSLPGYLAVPDGPGPWPGMVVIHDVGGLTDDIRRHADRLAAAGFLAAAPNLYRGNAIRCVVSMMRSLKTGVGPAVDDVEAVRDLIAADPRCALCRRCPPEPDVDHAVKVRDGLNELQTGLDTGVVDSIVSAFEATTVALRDLNWTLHDTPGVFTGELPHVSARSVRLAEMLIAAGAAGIKVPLCRSVPAKCRCELPSTESAVATGAGSIATLAGCARDAARTGI